MLSLIESLENKYIFYVLITLTIIAVLLYIFRTTQPPNTKEGFQQREKFVLKQNADSYDGFYSHIYDKIHMPQKHTDDILKTIFNSTGADESSVVLDVGCGTGEVMGSLQKTGAKCMGIDKSQAMVSQALSKYPDIRVQCSDVLDPINYNRKTFSHILCLNFTIYEIENKTKFFENCKYWLKNGGYLVIHVVNKQKFNTVVNAGLPVFIDNPQKHTKERITKSSVNFLDFVYDAKYDIKPDNDVVTFTETFTDGHTKHIRQNERTLFMESEANIVKIARDNGFTLHGQINMEPINDDMYQYLYIFV